MTDSTEATMTPSGFAKARGVSQVPAASKRPPLPPLPGSTIVLDDALRAGKGLVVEAWDPAAALALTITDKTADPARVVLTLAAAKRLRSALDVALQAATDRVGPCS